MSSLKVARTTTSALLVRLIITLVMTLLAAHAVAKGSQPPQKAVQTNGHSQFEAEAMLIKTLIEIRNNRLTDALAEVEKVIQSYPNFRLAHLIKGDLLLSRSRPLREPGEAPDAPRGSVQDLRDEARVRLARYQFERPTDRLPKYLLQLSPEQKHAILVDTRQSTLYVFENHDGVPRYVADYYISSGKNGSDKSREGDKKTPLGVYHVTANLSRAAWSQQKRQVNAAKSWIKVKLDRVSIFLYPGQQNLAVVTFDQDYSSSNLSNQMKKRQYWINEDGSWRILYEGTA